MTKIAIIGGTGLSDLEGLTNKQKLQMETPFGSPSSDLLEGELLGKPVVFLARHGENHTIAPHRINYRANIWALKERGVDQILAVAAVGGISAGMAPGTLAVPDQIIDYSHDREQSFFSDNFSMHKHIDFSYPYSENLRQKLLLAAQLCNLDVLHGGTYGVTQGPRLETAAEIKRLKQDGCTMVGMTAMPEACLARELAMQYASCALSVNWAAGLTAGVIAMEQIESTLQKGQLQIADIIKSFIQQQ